MSWPPGADSRLRGNRLQPRTATISVTRKGGAPHNLCEVDEEVRELTSTSRGPTPRKRTHPTCGTTKCLTCHANATDPSPGHMRELRVLWIKERSIQTRRRWHGVCRPVAEGVRCASPCAREMAEPTWRSSMCTASATTGEEINIRDAARVVVPI